MAAPFRAEAAGRNPEEGNYRHSRELPGIPFPPWCPGGNPVSSPRVPRTSVRTKRTPGGVRPRRLDWHIDSPPVYAKAPTATTNHQQGRNGTKTVFPRTPPKEIAWFRYRREPFSLRVSVQLDRTDFLNPARVSLLNRLEQGDKMKMQPVPVIPCREETTARVDVLRRQPHAGRWER